MSVSAVDLKTPWDAAVVGGGPAGSAAAIGLARAGHRTLLIDAGGHRRKVGESLPAGARPLLHKLGALDGMATGPHLESRGVWSSWGHETLVAAEQPLLNPHGAGWHLDRQIFDEHLRNLAHGAGAILESARVRQIDRVQSSGGNFWRLQDSYGVRFNARWLVDATGRSAAFARCLGARRRRDDNLVAIAAWLRATDDDSRTLIEAVPEGWWYTARLPGNERVVVLHVAADRAAAIIRHLETWTQLLAETRWIRRIAANVITEPRVHLLDGPRGAEAGGARLDRFHGDGWLAVGDAALSFDPLSSQGMMNALYTGVLAGEAVVAGLQGDTRPQAAYTDQLEQVRKNYLRHHRQAYRNEHRWPQNAFWRPRR